MTRKYLRTTDLAKAGGISVQQVRNYEKWEIMPPVALSSSGYRLYTDQHLKALTTARALIQGYSWQSTRQIMQAIHHGELASALALVDEYHAQLAHRRQQAEQTLAALHLLATSLAEHSHPSN